MTRASHSRSAGVALGWKVAQLGSARALQLVRTIILAGILLREDFGVFAIALAVMSTALAATELGMYQSLVQQDAPSDDDYDTAWTVGQIRRVILFVALYLSAPLLAQLFAEPRSEGVIRLLALRPVLESLASTRTARLMGQMQFRPLAVVATAGALVETAVAIVLAPGLGYWALAWGALSGAAVSSIASHMIAPARLRWVISRESAASLMRFGRWIFGASFAAVVTNLALYVILARTLGTGAVGVYYWGVKITQAPLGLAGEAVAAVFFPLFARLRNERQELSVALRSALSLLLAIFFPLAALFIVFAPGLVLSTVGSEWEAAIPVIQILVASWSVGIFGEIVVALMRGAGTEGARSAFNMELLQSTALIVAVYPLVGAFGVVGAALAWVPAMALSQLYGWRILTRMRHVETPVLFRPLAASAISITTGTAAALLALNAFPFQWGLPAAIAVACIVLGITFVVAERAGLLGFVSSVTPFTAWRGGS